MDNNIGVGSYHLSHHPPILSSCQCGEHLWYPGLSCSEVRQLLPPALTATSALNFAGFFLGVWLTAAAVAVAQRQQLRRRRRRSQAHADSDAATALGSRRRRQSA